MDNIKYIKVDKVGGMRQYSAIRTGAKGRTYHGTSMVFPWIRSSDERKNDMVAFITVDKNRQGGTYTDDSG